MHRHEPSNSTTTDPKQQSRNHRPNRSERPLFAVIIVAALVSAVAMPAFGQINQRVNGRMLRTTSTLVLPSPPRELRRDLERAKRFVADGQFTEAVELLDAILADPDSEDFFLRNRTLDNATESNPDDSNDGQAKNDEPNANDLEPVPAAPGNRLQPTKIEPDANRDLGTNRSTLKTEACRILGSLPKQGREFYELQVGRSASRKLTEATQTVNLSQVDEVSRRYFHTQAGYEATLLLARIALDQQQPTTAAIHLARLREAPQAARRYEPQLSVLLALARSLQGRETEAIELLESARQSFGRSKLKIRGKSVSLPEGDRAAAFLADLKGPVMVGTEASLAEWRQFRGSNSRNAESRGGMPLAKLEWKNDTAVFSSDASHIERIYEEFQSAKLPAIPVVQPIAVGDLLIVQAARMILGIDLTTGRRIWPYPWNTDELAPTRRTPSALSTNRLINAQPHSEMKNRVWHDFVHAQMSSDGERLFILRPSPRKPSTNQRFGFNSTPIVPRNRLVALELASEGKTIWRLGSEDGDNAELADAYFLGAPVPVDGKLYVVAELKDELKLLVMDPESGQLLWTQQLGLIERPAMYARYGTTNLDGSCPAFADGILVCPTSFGSIVAVDTQRRWLLWSYSYATSAAQSQPAAILQQRANLSTGNRWLETAPVVVEGKVLVSPVESNELHCLDLLTGEKLWSISRRNALYVAGAWNGMVVLAGRNGLSGMDLETGIRKWTTIKFPGDATLAGRGYYSDGHYHAPTTAPALLRFNVQTGKMAEELSTDFELGNLICHGNYVISQNHNSVIAFLQRDRIRDKVASDLSANPDDRLSWKTMPAF